MATNFGEVVQLTNENFINPFGILKPQIRRELLAFQNYDYFMTEILEELTMEEPVAGFEWSTFVEPKKIEPLVVSANFAAGATDAEVTISIDPSTIANNKSFARERMRVRRSSNGQILFIQTVQNGANTIKVLPKTGTAVAAGLAGETLVLISNASPEGSDGLDTYTGKARKITNQLQIIRGAARATGSVTADELWFDLSQYGAEKQGWFDYEIISEVMRYMYQMNLALLLEEQDTLTVTEQYGTFAGTTVRTTNGIIPQTKLEGKTINYNSGEPSLQWFYKIMNSLTGQYGDKENFFFQGQELKQYNTQWILDTFKNGAIQYGAFNGNKEMALNLGFDSIAIDGFTFHQKNFDLYNMPDGLGAQGYTKNGFILPTTPVKVVSDLNGSSKSMGKPVRLRYKPMPGAGNSKMKISPLDGLRHRANPTSSNDVNTYDIISEMGIELLAPWKGIVVEFAGQ